MASEEQAGRHQEDESLLNQQRKALDDPRKPASRETLQAVLDSHDRLKAWNDQIEAVMEDGRALQDGVLMNNVRTAAALLITSGRTVDSQNFELMRVMQLNDRTLSGPAMAEGFMQGVLHEAGKPGQRLLDALAPSDMNLAHASQRSQALQHQPAELATQAIDAATRLAEHVQQAASEPERLADRMKASIDAMPQAYAEALDQVRQELAERVRQPDASHALGYQMGLAAAGIVREASDPGRKAERLDELADTVATKPDELARTLGGGAFPPEGRTQRDFSGAMHFEKAVETLDGPMSRVHYQPAEGHSINALVDRNGQLHYHIIKSDGERHGHGDEMFASMVRKFEENGVEITGLRDIWRLNGRDSTNGRQYREALERGDSAETAAFRTFSGVQARELGLNRVSHLDAAPGQPIRPVFDRPDWGADAAWGEYANRWVSSMAHAGRHSGDTGFEARDVGSPSRLQEKRQQTETSVPASSNALEKSPDAQTSMSWPEYGATMSGGAFRKAGALQRDFSHMMELDIYDSKLEGRFSKVDYTPDLGSNNYVHGLVDDDHRLSFEIASTDKKYGYGTEMFASMVRKFDQHRIGIDGLDAYWIRDSVDASTNAHQFEKAIGEGYSPERAAFSTFTGRQAQELGLTRATFPEEKYEGILTPKFDRPDWGRSPPWSDYANAWVSTMAHAGRQIENEKLGIPNPTWDGGSAPRWHEVGRTGKSWTDHLGAGSMPAEPGLDRDFSSRMVFVPGNATREQPDQVRYEPVKGHWALGTVDARGRMDFGMHSKAGEEHGFEDEMFRSMVRKLDTHRVEVKGFDLEWNMRSASGDTNADHFLRALAEGRSIQSAAFDTFAGRQAQELGFTRVTIPPMLHEQWVTPSFDRPDWGPDAGWRDYANAWTSSMAHAGRHADKASITPEGHDLSGPPVPDRPRHGTMDAAKASPQTEAGASPSLQAAQIAIVSQIQSLGLPPEAEAIAIAQVEKNVGKAAQQGQKLPIQIEQTETPSPGRDDLSQK